jgi:hypothetical protein
VAIRLVCPGCKRPLHVPDSAAGKTARCPACSASIPVPIVAEVLEVANPYAPPTAPPSLPPPLPTSGSVGDDAVMRMLLPVGRSWWAIAAGYAGLLAICGVPAPFALILGAVAIWDIKSHPKRHGLGRAYFGVVMGILGTCLLFYVIAAGVLRH